MKIKIGKDVYEVTKNGKPLVGPRAGMEAFLVFTPRWARYVAVAVTTDSPSSGPKAEDLIRAITFAVDEAYVDTVVAAVDKKWPGSAAKAGKSNVMRCKHELRRKVVRTRLAKRAPGCRGSEAKTKR